MEAFGITTRSTIFSKCFRLKMDESGQQWREKREEDRTWNEVLEVRMGNKNTMRTMIKLTKEKFSFINNNIIYSLTFVSFIEYKR